MVILGIDTSGAYTCLAISKGDKLIAQMTFGASNDHSEQLIDYIELILKSAKLSIKDIDLFASSIGPGSFTGTRIAIATVKAFSQALNKPVVGISTLEILIENLSVLNTKAAIIDAKRDRVYAILKSNEEYILKEGIYAIEDFIDIAKDLPDLVICGEGTIVFKELLDNNNLKIANNDLNLHRAFNLCRLAKNKFEKEGADNIFELAPNYMGKSQAQIDYEKRHGKCLK
ncbi:MAG: tRNA (adenosine(37)-N6)-threonylcarbamoyltransferase complex dimerization subunit type 1 TsaB [Tissierellia bacterium]|nr:tRNA (adenosine(37)-N6)-threonylcarbamoyltransferase complex dimerization subunit type 1 TsaB [Tissierellia bacterium]